MRIGALFKEFTSYGVECDGRPRSVGRRKAQSRKGTGNVVLKYWCQQTIWLLDQIVGPVWYVGSLIFQGLQHIDVACKEGFLSEYEIDCDGVLGTLLLPDAKHLFNLASCAVRKCDANARLAYDRRFQSVSLKQIKTIRSVDQFQLCYGDDFGKFLKKKKVS